MSGTRTDRFMSLAGVDLRTASEEELSRLIAAHLANGIHGLCFSAYEDGQRPGDLISERAIRARLDVIGPHCRWIRTFSCTDGNELIPAIAREYGLKTLVGAWIGTDPEVNEREVAGLIALANAGVVDIAAVGNEVMYRGDASEDELLAYLAHVKAHVRDVPVGYVDAYYEFEARPRVTEQCDVVLANCYPFWEGCGAEHAHLYMKDMYHRALRAANGRPVIISETGWPDAGSTRWGAIPSRRNAMKYLVDALTWSATEAIPMFYFSAFDEGWKVDSEGDVGAYWGIWDRDFRLKY